MLKEQLIDEHKKNRREEGFNVLVMYTYLINSD